MTHVSNEIEVVLRFFFNTGGRTEVSGSREEVEGEVFTLRDCKLVEMRHEQRSFDVDFLVCASRVKSDAAKCAKLSNWLAMRGKPHKLIRAGSAHG